MKAEWTNRDNLSIETTSQNNKAILVIDMPKDCRRCQLMVDRFCYGIPMDEVHDSININERPKWCPLRPFNYKFGALGSVIDPQGYTLSTASELLEEITGETE